MNEEQKQAIQAWAEKVFTQYLRVADRRSLGQTRDTELSHHGLVVVIWREQLIALLASEQPKLCDLATYLREGVASGRIPAKYVLEQYGGTVRCAPEVKALVRELESAHE